MGLFGAVGGAIKKVGGAVTGGAAKAIGKVGGGITGGPKGAMNAIKKVASGPKSAGRAITRR